MNEIIVILFMIPAAIVGMFIYLLVSLAKVKTRLAKLETQLDPVAEPAKPEATTKTPPKSIVAKPAPQKTKSTPFAPKKSFVFTPALGKAMANWLQKNWFFAVAGVSLALAGVFLVQYGVENGLLTPTMRVIGAIALGVALIVTGEFVRRKLGKDEGGSFALLPSVFSGAGLVSIFAGVLAARMLYGLIGAELAFAALVLTGIAAITLGWYYGALLAIIGVFGALAAPFLVGGPSDAAQFLFPYFALIAAIALGIDSFKRWAWLSVLGLIGAYGAALLLYVQIGQAHYFMGFALITAALAAVLLERHLMPRQSGVMVLQLFQNYKQGLPAFPARVAFGAFLASTAIAGFILYGDDTAFWLVLVGLALLTLAAVFWMQRAAALADLAFLPPPLALWVLMQDWLTANSGAQDWVQGVEVPMYETAPPIIALIIAGGIIISAAFAWRSYQGGAVRIFDAVYAAAFAPLVAVLLEVFWQPAGQIGGANWAIFLASIAIAMTALAVQFSRKDSKDRTRASLFALSAMSMLSFMLVVFIGPLALTLSLAIMVLTAAWLGRQFRLPLLDWYVQVGVVAVSWRLVFDPDRGIIWAIDRAKLWELSLDFLPVIFLLFAASRVIRKDAAKSVPVVLESAIWSLSGIYLTLMVLRFFDYVYGGAPDHLIASMLGLIWLILSANQLYRVRPDTGLRRTRIVLTAIYGLVGGLLLGLSVVLNPVTNGGIGNSVNGPPVLDTLAAAYALPAALFLLVAFQFRHIKLWLRKVFGVIGVALAVLYTGLEIRRFWQGDVLSGPGMPAGELYSYTVAMLLAAAALLVLAFMRQSATLRKLALVAVGLTVAKVFLIDMSGLDGLIRVVSFLVLGLVLAAMAWVNRILQNNETNKT